MRFVPPATAGPADGEVPCCLQGLLFGEGLFSGGLAAQSERPDVFGSLCRAEVFIRAEYKVRAAGLRIQIMFPS